MTKKQKALVRYSDCFKLSIVEEIEKNGLSIEDCRRKYDIKRRLYNSELARKNMERITY